MAQIDLKLATLYLRDGSSPKKTLEVKIGTGTFTYDEKRTMEYQKDRGNLDVVREGDQQEMDVKFDFQWNFLRNDTGDTDPSFEEFLKKVGKASAYVSSDPDTCQPYSVDIVLLYVPVCGGVKNEKIVCPLFRWESMNHDAKAGQVAVTGKCNVTQATVTRQVGVTV